MKESTMDFDELLVEYRRAYSRWEDQSSRALTTDRLLRLGGLMRDAMVAMDNAMTAGQPHPYRWPAHPADVYDGRVWEATSLPPVPADHPVQPLADQAARERAVNPAQCGACRRWWDDGVSTAWTPAPSGRCPFEYWHVRTDLFGQHTRV